MKNYTGKNDIAPYVTTIVSNALKNSIHNYLHKDDFVPISIRSLENGTEQISLQILNGKTIEEIINQLDENLEYEGATRLSKKGLEIIAELENKIKELAQGLRREEIKKSRLEEDLKKTDEAIKKFSSETTRKKILSDSGRYQFPDPQMIQAAPSDKEIIEGNITTKSVENSTYGETIRPPDYESKTKLPIGTDIEVEMKKIASDEKARDIGKSSSEIREYTETEKSKETKLH